MMQETIVHEQNSMNFDLNPASYFKEAPTRDVGEGHMNATLRPSPSDIPSRVEIRIAPDQEFLAGRTVSIGRFEYPTNSEPVSSREFDGTIVQTGRNSGRIIGVSTPLEGDLEDLELRDAVQALVAAIELDYDAIPQGERTTTRKQLNNLLARNVLMLLEQNQ